MGEALTKADVQALMARPVFEWCQCQNDGSMHAPGPAGTWLVCVHDLRAMADWLAPYAAVRVRDPGSLRMSAAPGAMPCQCGCGCRSDRDGTYFQADLGPGFLCPECERHQPPPQGDGWEILRRS